MKKNPQNKKNKQSNKQLSNKNSQSSKKNNKLNNQSSHRLNNKNSKPNHKNNRLNHKNKETTSANKQSNDRNKHQNKKKQRKQPKNLSNRKKQNSQHTKQLGFLALTQDIVFKSFFSRNKPVLISLLKSFLPITNPITNITILNPEIRDKQNNHPHPKTENKNQARSNKRPQPNQKSVQTLNNPHSFLEDSRLRGKDGFKDSNTEPSNKEQLNQLNQLSLQESSVYPNPVNKKQIVLDLRVKLSSGENINVEMQTINQKHLLKRILFYWAKLYSQDLEKGENYNKIHPAYSLIFTTFPVLDQQSADFMSSFSIRRDIKPHQLFNKDLKIVIVELSKLKKPYDELLDLKEKWCYILRDSSKITKQEYISLSEDEEMKMALRHLNRLSREEELYQEALTEKINQVAYDLDRAGLLEEGMERGLEKGRVEIALNMLKEGSTTSFVSKVTGLSIEEIAKLKK